MPSENLIRIYHDGERDIIEYIYQKFGGSSAQAVRVFRCESGLRALVVSPSNDYGIGQINYSAHQAEIPGETKAEKIEWLFNYKNNIDFAYSLYKANGWKDWSMSRSCWDKPATGILMR